MSDTDDDGRSCSSNDDGNDDDSSEDDNQNDNYAPSCDYDNTDIRLYDDEEKRMSMYHPNQSGKTTSIHSGPSLIPKNASTKHVPASYVSLIKQTEDEMELVSRKSRHTHHHGNRNNEDINNKITARRKSHNAVTLYFGGRRNLRNDCDASLGLMIKSADREDDQKFELEFPLRNFAAGVSDSLLSMQDAKNLETSAKKKLKSLKNDLQIAQLDVADAKLLEFSAKLQARQVKIHENYAKLCRRRVALRQAEEEQAALEAKLDAEEEDQRERERRVKNRERRVNQEEAGLRIKEAALRKREVEVSKAIERIDQWRKIVDEKEEVQKQMEDIVEKKEELQEYNGRNRDGWFPSKTKKIKANYNRQSSEQDIRKPDMFGQLMSGFRRHHIDAGNRDNPNSFSKSNGDMSYKQNDIQAGALSIWL